MRRFSPKFDRRIYTRADLIARGRYAPSFGEAPLAQVYGETPFEDRRFCGVSQRSARLAASTDTGAAVIALPSGGSTYRVEALSRQVAQLKVENHALQLHIDSLIALRPRPDLRGNVWTLSRDIVRRRGPQNNRALVSALVAQGMAIDGSRLWSTLRSPSSGLMYDHKTYTWREVAA